MNLNKQIDLNNISPKSRALVRLGLVILGLLSLGIGIANTTYSLIKKSQDSTVVQTPPLLNQAKILEAQRLVSQQTVTIQQNTNSANQLQDLLNQELSESEGSSLNSSDSSNN